MSLKVIKEVSYNEFGISSIECIFKNGEYVNELGPCSIYYYNNGSLLEKSFVKDFKSHNENGPAYIQYYIDNKILYIEYNLNDQKTNKFGAATLAFNELGFKSCESYVNDDGDYSNTNGPAVIYFDNIGNVIGAQYWINGKEINVNSDEEFKKYIKLLNLS